MAPSTSLFPHTYPSPSRIWATRDRPGSTGGRVSARISRRTRRGGGVEPGTYRVAEDRRHDAEQPADGRAEDAGHLGGQRVGRDRPRKQSERHQHRAEGARRRLEERPGAAEQGGQGEDRPQPAPERRPDCQPHRVRSWATIASGEDAAAVVSVGGLTGDEGEGEQREELGQADHPDREGGFARRTWSVGRPRRPPTR